MDLEGLQSDFGARSLSWTDFRWLLQRPMTPSSMAGLRQLLGLYEDSGISLQSMKPLHFLTEIHT